VPGFATQNEISASSFIHGVRLCARFYKTSEIPGYLKISKSFSLPNNGEIISFTKICCYWPFNFFGS
jgi:hypothetical protein